jgi:integrase
MPAKGDGITKRKDGRYMARYTIETPDGPKRKTIYGRKYKEVEKKLAEARGDAARGLVFDADNLKLGEYLDRWLTDSVADTVRPTTFERYEQIVRVHIRPVFGKLKLKNVTPAHVRGLYREKLEVGLSPAPFNISTSHCIRLSSKLSPTASFHATPQKRSSRHRSGKRRYDL